MESTGSNGCWASARSLLGVTEHLLLTLGNTVLVSVGILGSVPASEQAQAQGDLYQAAKLGD